MELQMTPFRTKWDLFSTEYFKKRNEHVTYTFLFRINIVGRQSIEIITISFDVSKQEWLCVETPTKVTSHIHTY